MINFTGILMVTISLFMFPFSSVTAQLKKDSKNILIVYLSRTKNTQAVAQLIHQETGGKLVELELVTPYPENYQQIVAQVSKENETGYLPVLKTKIDSIDKYNIVFIGFPTWGMQLPPPIKSFLNQNSFAGKTIVPFNTHAVYGMGNSIETINKYCPDSRILKPISFEGGKEKEGRFFVMRGKKKEDVASVIRSWLLSLGIYN
ncbi:flavodoxin [Flavihumibacter sp. UBA7668]|uniref:flavodoxin n=1 Tax=Flavihumibacter sp. UBA7668 TaxID=1946542 RepID=UPI0025BFB1D1|nr:flavodoxin [Flavihumibacter sp. UBA7668]